MLPRTYPLPGQLCPACRASSLSLTESTENADYFGQVLLTTIFCSRCGYKDSDVSLVAAGEPNMIRARIVSRKDLAMKVVRSSSATIRIPKLGVSIRPRISAESFITNIEGVLDRVQQVLEGIIPGLPPKRKSRANKVLMNLKKARQGKLSFFLELIDPSGRSGIAGRDMTKINRRPLSKRELEKLEDSQ